MPLVVAAEYASLGQNLCDKKSRGRRIAPGFEAR